MCARRLAVRIAIVCVGALSAWTRVADTQALACAAAPVQGSVIGIDRGLSCEFLGVPYGAPPVGNARWQPPAAAAPWAPAVFSATVPPPTCPLFTPAGQPAGSEDCLKLNIWAPNPRRSDPAPVIVWLHPGSFVAASANLAAQNGRNFVERTGTIVVVPNYRLGPFGFLGHSALRTEDPTHPTAGNYGFLDQRLALEWVRANIASFGGDPTRVTIAGNSAGGLSVSLHLVSPGSQGLFHRAVMQGGFASYRWRTRDDAESQAEAFAAALGCTDRPTVLACLRSKTRDEILRALPTGQEQFAETGRTHWSPTIDGLDVPDQPRRLFRRGKVSSVPVIIGSNRDEGFTWVSRSVAADLTASQYEAALMTEFGADAPAILAAYPAADFATPRDALAQVVTDAEYTCGAQRLARSLSRRHSPVYVYRFDHEVDAVTPDRAFHGLDVNLLFGNNFGPPSNHVLAGSDLELFRTMSDYWSRFAASGDPNGGDGEVGYWPAYQSRHDKHQPARRHLVLAAPQRIERRPRPDPCAFWKPYFFRSITGAVPAWTP